MNEININIRKDENAKTPVYMSDGAAGADVYASEDIVINPHDTKLVHTGIYMEIPEGFECQIRPRSGLALKHNLIILNSPGTIDSDYRGEVMIIMHNMSDKHYTIKLHDRIAQMIFAPVMKAQFIESGISDTVRNSGGFGHTGKRDD